MLGPVRIGLLTAALVLAATPVLAGGYEDQAYASGYTVSSGQSYSRSVQVQDYGADYAGRPVDYAPGDEPTEYYPQSSAYEARYDDGYAPSGAYSHGGYHGAGYGAATQTPCPQMGGERVVRCVYRPIREEIRINTADFDGGVGVIPSSGGGGGFVMVGGGGMVSAGARAYASASISARVSVRGGGGHRDGGCNSCGGGGKH